MSAATPRRAPIYTTHLDPEGIRWMRDLLKGMADEGRTVLVSSHLLSEMEILADDLVIIAGGKLIAQGTVEDIISSIGAEQVRVVTPHPQELIAALPKTCTIRDGDANALVLTGIDAPALGETALRIGVAIHSLGVLRPDLENVFLQLTAGKAAIR
jgi:ABC-2 type transport system ATP-binding protein